MRVLANLADGSCDLFKVHDLLGLGRDLWHPSLRPPPGGEESNTFFSPGAQKGGFTQFLFVSNAVVVPHLIGQVRDGVGQREVVGLRPDLAVLCFLPLPAGEGLQRAVVA